MPAETSPRPSELCSFMPRGTSSVTARRFVVYLSSGEAALIERSSLDTQTRGGGNVTSTDTDLSPIVEVPESAKSALSAIRFPIVANVVVIAMNFLSGVVAAKLLGPAGRGVATSVLTVPTQLAVVFLYSSNEACNHLIAKRRLRRGAALEILWNRIFLQGSACVAVSALFLFVSFGRPWLILSFSVFPMMISVSVTSVLLGSGREIQGLLVRVVEALVPAVVLCVALASFQRASPAFGVFAYTLGTTLAGAAGLLWARPLTRATPTIFELGEVAGFTKQQGPASAWTVALIRLDYLVLPFLVSNRDLGLYVIATSVSSIIPSVIGSMASPLLARMSRPESTSREIRVIVATLACAAIGLTTALSVVASFALPLVYGNSYSRSVTIMLVMLPGTFCIAMATVLGAPLTARGLSREILSSAKIAAIASFVAIVLLTYEWGILGAAAAGSLSYAVLLGLRARPFFHLIAERST